MKEFISQYVRESDDNFVVKVDLMNAFTKWRQSRAPVMQLKDLDAADEACHNIFPAANFVEKLMVQRKGQLGFLNKCWKGFEMDYDIPGVEPQAVDQSD